MADPVRTEAEAPAVERRSARRTSVLLAAELEIDGKIIPATLLNLSVQGAMLSCEDPPRSDANLILRRGTLETAATVAWVNGGHVGVKFENQISQLQIAAILRR